MMRLWVYSLVLSVASMFTKCEFFTSISELETLLQTERELANTLDRYIEAEEKRLQRVRRLSLSYQRMYESASGNAEKFLSHPVHAFLLVKHLTADWKAAVRIIDEPQSKVVFANLSGRGDLKFPGDEDLSGAATALIRLQDTYLLNTSRVASGRIEGATDASWQLSAGDCFELGHQAFVDEDYRYCVQWMEEALRRLEGEGDSPTVQRRPALEHMAYASYMIGKADDAERLTRKIIDEDPSYMTAYANLAFYQQYQRDLASGAKEGPKHEPRSARQLAKLFVEHFEEYEKLCRGERVQSLELQSRLHCRSTPLGNPYLLLQPIKEEVLSLDPRIVLFHDVISDKDAQLLKELAIPKLERATVANAETGNLEPAQYRVSKSSWLEESEHAVVRKCSRFMHEVTGLELSSAEELHVINYGIGGHYEPHCDFQRVGEGEVDNFAGFGIGNRMATWIYYLSDVEAGGFTVFPSIGVHIKPIKGSAALWYNLRRNGEGDMNTKHAACPVLTGSKWVANKWLHEVDNEFRRKCALDRSE